MSWQPYPYTHCPLYLVSDMVTFCIKCWMRHLWGLTNSDVNLILWWVLQQDKSNLWQNFYCLRKTNKIGIKKDKCLYTYSGTGRVCMQTFGSYTFRFMRWRFITVLIYVERMDRSSGGIYWTETVNVCLWHQWMRLLASCVFVSKDRALWLAWLCSLTSDAYGITAQEQGLHSACAFVYKGAGDWKDRV